MALLAGGPVSKEAGGPVSPMVGIESIDEKSRGPASRAPGFSFKGSSACSLAFSSSITERLPNIYGKFMTSLLSRTIVLPYLTTMDPNNFTLPTGKRFTERKDGKMNKVKNFLLDADSLKQRAKAPHPTRVASGAGFVRKLARRALNIREREVDMFRLSKIRSVIALGVLAFALQTVAVADVVVIRSGSGADAAAIQATVEQFRTDLGNPNNGNAAGPLPGGHREINWDGAGAVNTAPGGTPFTVFQNTRGTLITTPGTGFLQTPVNTPEFLAINPTYGATFEFFSPVRIFTPLGSNILDMTFSVPGSAGVTTALVAGFGSVFSDVDLANTTSLQFFDINNNSLGTFFAPTANNGLSFIGALFDSAVVSRVRIVNGNSALGPNDGGGIDVVVMDDFLYSEPQTAPVPEPATMILLGAGLAGFAAKVRRRRKQ